MNAEQFATEFKERIDNMLTAAIKRDEPHIDRIATLTQISMMLELEIKRLKK